MLERWAMWHLSIIHAVAGHHEVNRRGCDYMCRTLKDAAKVAHNLDISPPTLVQYMSVWAIYLGTVRVQFEWVSVWVSDLKEQLKTVVYFITNVEHDISDIFDIFGEESATSNIITSFGKVESVYNDIWICIKEICDGVKDMLKGSEFRCWRRLVTVWRRCYWACFVECKLINGWTKKKDKMKSVRTRYSSTRERTGLMEIGVALKF